MSDGHSEIALDESSPRPWYFDGWDIFSAGTRGGVNNDGHRLVLPASHLDQTWHPSQRMNRADLQLIVEAVNAYDAEREWQVVYNKSGVTRRCVSEGEARAIARKNDVRIEWRTKWQEDSA